MAWRFLCLLTLCGAFGDRCLAANTPPRPDILLIMPDQMRGDCLSTLGHPVLRTPQLDKLAGQGVLFRRAYTTAPSCIPARFALLTGLFPQTSGVVGYGHKPIKHQTMPGLLSQAGYLTALVGRSMHQIPENEPYGYEKWIGASIHIPDDDYDVYLKKVAPQTGGIDKLIGSIGLDRNGWKAAAWPLETEHHPIAWTVKQSRKVVAETPEERPLFLTTSFFAPHPPLCPPKKYFDRYMAEKLPATAKGSWVAWDALPRTKVKSFNRILLEGETLQRAQAGYFGLIEFIDDEIAPLIEEFKARSRRAGRPWLIVFTSDHGEMLGDHGYFRKCEPYEGATNIPFIIAASPELRFLAGARSFQPVCLEDIMPTLLELAGAECPKPIDGISLVSVLDGKRTDVRKWLHFEHAKCYSKEQAFHAITDGRYKYIWRPENGGEQLFDLQNDPREETDLSNNADHRATLEKWRDTLVARLAGRPEGFSNGHRLIPGRPYPPVQAETTDLDRGFIAPPRQARLRCFWWWLNGNVTKAAITRDLEEMKAKGFGGMILYDGDGASQRGNAPVPAGPAFGSSGWRELFRHAVSEADRLELEICLVIQSGWNLGGPPVTLERAAKVAVHSETPISGGGLVETDLPAPKQIPQSKRNPNPKQFYRDIAVVAYRAAAAANASPAPSHQPIKMLEHKLAMQEMPKSAPDGSVLLDDVPSQPGEAACRGSEVLDLTDKMDAQGKLRWEAPPGEWVVLRFGYVCTGWPVSTASEGWQGDVLDHLNADDLRWYWNQVVEPLLADAGPAVGKTLKYVTTDSWECGGMNWTPAFRDEFRRRRGYDLLPYLPVLAGRIVDSREVSNRFLADYRKTIGDCIAVNHYQVMKDLAARHGMGIQPESGGPHGAPIDSLRCLGISDIPMSEFWGKSPKHRVSEEDRFFVKQPASAAHTYGRTVAAAEGFTVIGTHWAESLCENLKPSFDQAACEGMNLLFWTTVTCSPAEMGLPGQEFFAGTHFNPNVTWWSRSGAFLSYINRCQFLLQQGRFVADAVYYYGDHVPNFAQLKKSDPAKVLPGYDYDVATEEVVLTRMQTVDGRIVLPDGMNYRVLVLPDRPIISPEVLRKVVDLVRAGATVIAKRPSRATGLGDYPASDEEVKRLADSLWGDCDGKSVTEHIFGKGRVFCGKTAREVLAADGITPDFTFEGDPRKTFLDYIHRTTGKTDIYFVANLNDRTESLDCTFRVAGKQPEIWDPVTGTSRQAKAFRQANGRTTVPLQFAPYGSLFVIFRKDIGTSPNSKTTDGNFPRFTPAGEITGPWTVAFERRWGPSRPVTFDTLVDWTTRPEKDIKYYSGAATYRKTFDLPESLASRKPKLGKQVYLDLGDVKELAEVRLNGKNLGVLWLKPFRVEITDAVKPAGNVLEVDVVNFWPNRLIGDATLAPEKRQTATNIKHFQKKSPLMKSGLLGPVTLQAAE